MVERQLQWEALRNGRDLGGLPVGSGKETRFASVVRSDTLRQLTPTGWQALAAYGIRTILDLRFQVEIDRDEPLDAGPGGLSLQLGRPSLGPNGRPAWLRTVPVSILGEPDEKCGLRLDRISRSQPDAVSSTRAVYLEMLEVFRARFAKAVAVVADTDEGGILIHCHAGKDRTGLVAALLLGVAGVSPEAIAADYAVSGPNIATSMTAWIDGAENEHEREHRRRVGMSPEQAMLDVLGVLESRYGGAALYLAGAGLPDESLVRARLRLVA